MRIDSDEILCPELKEKVQALRSAINKGKESNRFIKTPRTDSPAYTVTDTVTGKEVIIPLYALSEVMEALTTLFN